MKIRTMRRLFNATPGDGGDGGAGGGDGGPNDPAGGDGAGGGPSGGAASDWREGLSAEVIEELDKTGFKEPGQFATGYLDLQRKLGTSISIPHAESSDEDKAAFMEKLSTIDGVTLLPNSEDPESVKAFYTKLGKPEEVKGYEGSSLDRDKVTEQIGEERATQLFESRQQLLDVFAQVAHDNHLTKSQFKAFVDKVDEMDMASVEQFVSASGTTHEMLTKHIGDEKTVTARAAHVDRLAERLFGERTDLKEQFQKEIDPAGRPATFWLLQEMARSTLEDGKPPAGGDDGAGTNQTIYDLEQELAAITGNMQHAYYTGKRGDAEHDAAVAKVNRLNEQLARARGEPEFLPT